MGDRRVPQVVEGADLALDLGCGHRGSQRLLERLRPVDRPPLRVAEDQLVRALVRGPLVVPCQLGLKPRREGDRPHALLGLRVDHAEGLFQQVDVPPAQRL